MLPGSFFDEVAVKTELADQRIDLPETERRVGCALQVAAHEAIVESLHLKGGGAGIFDACNAVLLNEREQALKAADGGFGLQLKQGFGELTDARPCLDRKSVV